VTTAIEPGAGLGTCDQLVLLHDLDLLLHDLEDPASRQRLRKLGLAGDGAERLRAVRERVAAMIEARWLHHYERARARYGRGLAAVRQHVCGGCHVRLPVTARPREGAESLPTTCPGCGRLLSWS
jgi:predicted  nucleic acid-binding Zn-ribbon protein